MRQAYDYWQNQPDCYPRFSTGGARELPRASPRNPLSDETPAFTPASRFRCVSHLISFWSFFQLRRIGRLRPFKNSQPRERGGRPKRFDRRSIALPTGTTPPDAESTLPSGCLHNRLPEALRHRKILAPGSKWSLGCAPFLRSLNYPVCLNQEAPWYPGPTQLALLSKTATHRVPIHAFHGREVPKLQKSRPPLGCFVLHAPHKTT